MATQSQAPTVLLTRPDAQSQRFAAELQRALGPLRIIVSPLMAPSFVDVDLQGRRYDALILTSETGVEAAWRISATGQPLPRQAFCVGDRTASAAKDAGFDAISAQGDALALIALIQANPPAGPLLHLRGDEARGDIAKTLTNGGIETESVVAYTQRPQPLTPQSLQSLTEQAPLILPIFSPRSAQLLANALPENRKSPLWVAVISPAAAENAQTFAPARLVIATRPDAAAMVHAVGGLISLVTGP